MTTTWDPSRRQFVQFVGAAAMGARVFEPIGQPDPPPPKPQPAVKPRGNRALEVPQIHAMALGGPLGARAEANVRHWIMVADAANPAMFQIFRDRDRKPSRDLVPWAGEFAGKYLISAVQARRLCRGSVTE